MIASNNVLDMIRLTIRITLGVFPICILGYIVYDAIAFNALSVSSIVPKILDTTKLFVYIICMLKLLEFTMTG